MDKHFLTTAVSELHFLSQKMQLLCELAVGEDPDTPGVDRQDDRIALKRSALAALFVEMSEEVDSIRDRLKKAADLQAEAAVQPDLGQFGSDHE